MLLRFLGLALLVGWLGACDDRPNSPLGPDAGAPLYVLEALPSSALTLDYGQTGEVAVFVRDLESQPAPGLEVTFLLEGSFNDSGLSSVTAVTDESGLASTTVVAGYSNALFRVRMKADDADPIFRSVAVSVGGFGALAVTPSYLGARAVDWYRLALYFEATCAETRVVENGPPDRTLELPSGTAPGVFEPLPASSTYAIVLTEFHENGTALARGCIDPVALVAETTTEITILALDLPYVATGEYDATLALELGSRATALSNAATASATAAIGLAGGDASYLLDALHAALVSQGATEVATSLENERPALDATLDADLGAAGPTAAASVAGAALEDELAYVDLVGTLAVAARDAAGERLAFDAQSLVFTTAAADSEPKIVDLVAAAIDVPTTASSLFDLYDTTAGVDLTFALSASAVARGALLSAAERAAFDSVPAWLAGPAGCALLVGSAEVEAVVGAACNDACVEAACEAGLAELVSSMESGIATTPASTFASVRAIGTLSFADPDENLVEDAFDSTLVCTLTDGTALPPSVPGTFSGARAPIVPFP